MEAGALEVLLHLAIGVAGLELRVQDDVREDAAPEAVAEAEEPAHLVRLDSLERAAEPRLEGHALVGLEHQRVEHERAELPVAGPRLALAQALEGADVDEDRLSTPPLHVVRGGVLEDQVLVERAEQELELEQRGVLEHPERPLVRIRDDGDAVVAQDGGDPSGVELRRKAVRLGEPLGADELPLSDVVAEERRRRERLPVVEAALGQRPVDGASGVEDSAVRVAKGAALDPGLHVS